MRPLSELPKQYRRDTLLEMALIRIERLQRERADADPLLQVLREELGGDGMSGYTRHWTARQRLDEMYKGESK